MKAPPLPRQQRDDLAMDGSLHFSLKCGICSASQGVIGSSYLEYGASKVCVYVFAPRPMTRKVDFDEGNLECEISVASHLLNRVEEVHGAKSHPDGMPGVLSRLSKCTIDALTPAVRLSQYPKCTIMITGVILDSSSDDQAAIINASSAALCDAAVEMRDIVSSFSLLVNIAEGMSISKSVSSSPGSQLYIEMAYLAAIDEITSIETRGKCQPVFLLQLIDRMKKECVQIRDKIAIEFKSTQ